MHLATEANDSAVTLSPMEIDAIGEVLNISMGSAATAVSTMLDKQVNITTPRVCVEQLGMVEYSALEPALIVKITYTEGLEGTNVMVFRQRDMQLILNQLMGISDPPSDTFEFDDLSMSAACEVMNQMMGASATALSEFLGKTVNISTPEAKVMSPEYTFLDAIGMNKEESIVSVQFNMDIQDVMNTEFVSAMPCALAQSMVGSFLTNSGGAPETPAAPAPEAAAAAPAAPVPAPEPVAAAPVAPAAPAPAAFSAPAMQQPAMPQIPQAAPAAPMPDPAAAQQPFGAPPQSPMPQIPPGAPGGYPPYYPPYPAYPTQPGYPPYYPQYPAPNQPYPMPDMSNQPPVKVQNVQYPEFNRGGAVAKEPVLGGNAELLMNVPLDVTIEIGQTKRRIKEIMDFAQGTVIELEKQAGAPVDIVVNGQLIAHGDVVVIDDNFGVRITEILGTRELLNSLEKELK